MEEKKPVNPHKGHRERVRKKCLEKGIENLEDHELMEALLYYCIPIRDTNVKAHEIMNEFSSFSLIFNTNPADLKNRCGLTDNGVFIFIMIREIMRRVAMEKWKPKTVLSSSQRSGEFAMAILSYEATECFYVACLDSQNRLINYALIARGTVDEAHVPPRLVVEAALRYQASHVMLAHNHPGASLKPSKSDVMLTNKLVSIFYSIGITVTDHIIVGDNDFFSFADHDLIMSEEKLN